MEDAVGIDSRAGDYFRSDRLLLIQINETANSAYQILVDAGDDYCISFPFFTCMRRRSSWPIGRIASANTNAVLIPGGKFGVWLDGLAGISRSCWAESCCR